MKSALTLIEMLIVIVVLSFLLLIVIPRVFEAGPRAKEATLRSDLHQLRDAILQFMADCGDCPSRLDDLMTRPAEGTKGGVTGIALNIKGWQGPYFKTDDGELPIDPFTLKADWDYDPRTGQVHSFSTFTALNGKKYSEW